MVVVGWQGGQRWGRLVVGLSLVVVGVLGSRQRVVVGGL